MALSESGIQDSAVTGKATQEITVPAQIPAFGDSDQLRKQQLWG